MFRKVFPIVLIASVVFFLFLTNFSPGTWLTGWDNLHPEFNFPLNIKRSLFAVWQEYQGLGLLGGMGHASDLPRQIFLWFCSLILPSSFLRYFYTFLMLLMGPLGIYFLLDYLINKKTVSFSGALFYLLNLGTVQTFYVPFSAFITHYGFLPWLVLVLICYLEKPTRKNLLSLFVVNLLAVPQSYVPTMFVVYILVVVVFIVAVNLLKQKKFLSRSLKSLLVIFCVNAFWFLPFLYFLLTNSSVVAQSKTSLMVSEELFLRNKMFGDLANVALLKGFWFDTKDLAKDGSLFFMLEPWIKHLENRFILVIGYLFFAVILLGAVYSLKKKGSWFYSAFIFLFIFSFSMLAIATPPFSWINLILRKLVPFFAQVFRFPFTKFSILALLSYTVFFALGMERILLVSSKLRRGLPFFLTVICLVLLTIFTFPSFQGNFFYKRSRLKLPQEYFELFEFFKKQNPATRIANFPQAWHWGWSYYKWNYTGSGFLWYGIEQPILDRAFDVWSDKNEGYYWEVSHAAYSHNLPLFERVLEKYQINWILIDENIYATGLPKALQIGWFKEMLESSKIVSHVASFGKLKVYQVNLPIKEKEFVFFVDNALRVEPTYKWANEDRAFADQGIYYSFPTTHNPQPTTYFYYPFRELFTNNYVEDKNWWLEVKNQVISFKTKLPAGKQWTNESLNLNSLESKEEKILLYRDDLEVYELSPQVNIDDNDLEVQVSKYNLLRAGDIDFAQKIGKKETCDLFKRGKYDLEVIEEEKKFLRLSSVNTSSCVSFKYPYLDHNYSYLLEIESRNIRGKGLLFYVINETTKKAELEILLQESKKWAQSHYILPPKGTYGRGYSLHFDNASIGKEETVNDLSYIKIFPIPFNFLKRLKFVGSNGSEGSGKELLIYSQSYDLGWKAYAGRKEIKEHVLVNNWANGWLIESSKFKVQSSKFKIIYLPQYLEYLGFSLLFVFVLYLGLFQRYNSS